MFVLKISKHLQVSLSSSVGFIFDQESSTYSIAVGINHVKWLHVWENSSVDIEFPSDLTCGLDLTRFIFHLQEAKVSKVNIAWQTKEVH